MSGRLSHSSTFCCVEEKEGGGGDGRYRRQQVGKFGISVGGLFGSSEAVG